MFRAIIAGNHEANFFVFAVARSGVVLFSAPAAWACTTFLAQHAGQPVFGKGYDWDQGAGLVVTNARGLQRTGGQHKADIIARLRVRDGGP